MKKQTIHKKGTKVTINKGIVLDQSNNKCDSVNGVIISKPTFEKVQGYENEYNVFVDVMMNCGSVLTFNNQELNKTMQ